MKAEPKYSFYRKCFCIARVLFFMFFFYKVRGRENVPDGAAMICPNHSSYFDPILVSLALGIEHYVHYVAKIELFNVPVLSLLIKKLGAISVDRNSSDISTIKASLKFLKKGEKVSIFPEGRRAAADDEVSAKYGAVKLAERAGVPIVPVFVPRKKPLFGRLELVIGTPFIIQAQDTKRTADDYTLLVDSLMDSIEALNPAAQS